MLQSVGQFVAIRMIVLEPDISTDDFEDWMTAQGGFLEKMVDAFSDSNLERLLFLKGNKEGRLSQDGAGPNRSVSKAAGANADYAWISFWTDKATNEAAWKALPSPAGWYDTWRDFKEKCFSRGNGIIPKRPQHGPPFDYRGVPGQDFIDTATGNTIEHRGRGAGCLVEGFDVIWEWPIPLDSDEVTE